MIFAATVDQVIEVARNAINQSRPMGMGFMQYENKVYTSEDVGKLLKGNLVREGSLDLDYFRGRMVKTCIRRSKKSEVAPFCNESILAWRIQNRVDTEYQSWGFTYKSVS